MSSRIKKAAEGLLSLSTEIAALRNASINHNRSVVKIMIDQETLLSFDAPEFFADITILAQDYLLKNKSIGSSLDVVRMSETGEVMSLEESNHALRNELKELKNRIENAEKELDLINKGAFT